MRWKTLLIILLLAFVVDKVDSSEPRFDDPKIIERFEGVEPSWMVRASQKGLIVHKHFRTSEIKRTGNQSEFIHFKTVKRSNGSLVHALKKAQLINDYCPFVWIKSNQDTIKLSARVILPHTSNPVGPGALKVLVELDHSQSTDKWERLGCAPGDLIRQLNGRLRSIQFQFAELKIDTTDAYCDLVVLSGFDRPHREYQLWIDDLSHSGFLPARGITNSSTAPEPMSHSNQRIGVRDSQFRVNAKPFFLRAVSHNGESLAFLKQLGFNAVVLDRLPTVPELEQAQQYQVWIICPPILPENAAAKNLLQSKNLEMIFAWNIGSNLTAKDLDGSGNLVQRIGDLDKLIDRPVFCHSHFPQAEFSKLVDFRRLKHLTFGTSFGLNDFRKYLADEKKNATPIVVDIQTMLPGKIMEQSKLLPQPMGIGQLSRKQVVRLVFEALYAGARGVIFQSRNNLQQDQEVGHWQVPVFRSINRELMQIDPWIAGGTAKQLEKNKDPAILFVLPRSQLTLVFKSNRKTVRKRKATLQLSTNQQSPRVYKINETGVAPVLHQDVVGHLSIELSSEPGWDKFVVSEDTLSFEYIHQTTQSFANDGGILNDKYQVLTNEFERLQQIIETLSKEELNSPSLFVSMSEIQKSLVMIKTFLAKKQLTTTQTLLVQLEKKINLVTQSLQQELLASRKLISSSFNTDFDQLANYVALERLLRKTVWSDNLLQAGAFSSLKQMAGNGWKQHLNSSSGAQAAVSLSENQPMSTKETDLGTRSLQIHAWRSGAEDSAITVTPIWLTSPTIAVTARQVVRIDGYIKIDQPIQGSLDGFMILDSIGGPELGSRFTATDGWRYFAIERIVPRDMDLGLVLAQTGLGKVQISNLQIRTCRLDGSSFGTSQHNTAVPSSLEEKTLRQETPERVRPGLRRVVESPTK